MAKTTTHIHTYDLHINSFGEERAACTVCGFSVPLDMLKSRVNLDAITARKHATQRVRDLVEPAPRTQGPEEHIIISADRPVEYGTLDGDTIKVRP